jgi:hypothetical protein
MKYFVQLNASGKETKDSPRIHWLGIASLQEGLQDAEAQKSLPADSLESGAEF